MCILIYLILIRPVFDPMYKQKKQAENIYMSSISRIGPITKKYKLFLICTREWDQRGNLGLDPVLY